MVAVWESIDVDSLHQKFKQSSVGLRVKGPKKGQRNSLYGLAPRNSARARSEAHEAEYPRLEIAHLAWLDKNYQTCSDGVES